MKPQIVAEIEGEYGPLTVTEELVQKIWARGDFRRTDLQTQEGADLEILDHDTCDGHIIGSAYIQKIENGQGKQFLKELIIK